jgi:hypothetical protein
MNATRFERMTLWISLLLESHALPLRHASKIGFPNVWRHLWLVHRSTNTDIMLGRYRIWHFIWSLTLFLACQKPVEAQSYDQCGDIKIYQSVISKL